MGYKLLGMAVWKGGKWYVRREYGHLVPSRGVVLAGLVALVVAALALAGRKQLN
ncbi:MAG: hypothetical protein QOI98_2447 [Solirubrobacteraceae bacterium]|nr:hypothetical protein [Solirubrobacteraceae bacterium]